VNIFISHLCACTVNVKLICITVAKPWAVWNITFTFLAFGLLVVDWMWWKKRQQYIILNYWGKQRQRDVSNKWSRTGFTYYIVCYLYLIILFVPLLKFCIIKMIQNLKIHAFWDVKLCQLVNG
jgi:hypothetical protein